MTATRSERHRQRKHKKHNPLVISLTAIILVALYIAFGRCIPYGASLLTIREYNGIKQEEKLVKNIVYGYEFTLTDKFNNDTDVEQNDVGVPLKTISATKTLTKRIIDQQGIESGDILMGQIYRDFMGKDDIDYEQTSNNIKKDVPDQLANLNVSAMTDLSNRKVIRSYNKNRNTRIAKHFAERTGTIRN